MGGMIWYTISTPHYFHYLLGGIDPRSPNEDSSLVNLNHT